MTPPFDILVQDFFCRRLIEQQGVSPRTVEAYRDTFRLLLAYLPATARQAGPGALPGRSRRPDRPGIPRSSGDRARQRPAHAQRPAGGLALVRAIRRVARPDRLAAGPAGAGHPGQALQQAAARLPDPRGDAGRAERPGRRDLGRAAGPGAVRRDVQHRGPGVRGHRPSPGRSDRRQRTVAAHPRQGPQGACRAPVEADGRGTEPSGRSDSTPEPNGPLFPNARGQPLSRSGVEDRLALAVEQGRRVLPEPPGQDRLAPHDPAHDGDAPAAIRGRPDGHRAVAGPREPRDDPPVRRGRSDG